MPGAGDEIEPSVKRDRVARLVRVANLLKQHPEGMRAEDIAVRLGISKRTAYRDLTALEGELQMPTWSDGGRWGMLEASFLPPLKLTTSEAMAASPLTMAVLSTALIEADPPSHSTDPPRPPRCLPLSRHRAASPCRHAAE